MAWLWARLSPLQTRAILIFKKILKLHHKASPHFRGIRKMAAVHEDGRIFAWADEPHLYRNKKFLKGFEALAQYNLSFDAWT